MFISQCQSVMLLGFGILSEMTPENRNVFLHGNRLCFNHKVGRKAFYLKSFLLQINLLIMFQNLW